MIKVRTILGLIFAAMAAYAAIRGIFMIVPALTNAVGASSGDARLVQSGAIYLGVVMEAMAVILGLLATMCFRRPKTPPRQPVGPETDSER